MPAIAAEPINIAIALPLSGPQKHLGRDIRAAIELTLLDGTARGGSALAAFDISWHDDMCSSAGGTAVATTLTARAEAARPAIVIGHACPSAANAAATIYNSAGLPFLTAGALPSRAPNTHRFGSRHFRMQGDSTQGALIGATLVATPAHARIALVRDRTQFAQATLQITAAVLAAKSRSVVLVETFAGADKDFAALAARIKAAGITHIALAAFPSEAALLVPEIKRASPDVAILATDTLADPDFARAAGGAAEGLQVALAPDVRAYPGAADIARRLTASGAAPHRAALASAAALEVVMSAAASASLSQPEPLSAALASGAFDTILGSVRFDETGAARLPSHVLYTWRGGILVAQQ